MNNIMSTTRNEAWRAIQSLLANRRYVVLRLLLDRGPMTAQQIAKALGWAINRVTGRVCELRNQQRKYPWPPHS